MQEKHDNYNQCSMRKARRNNPWAEFAEEFRAEARKYKALRNELGRVFQPLQEEAYESYCAWEVEEVKQIFPAAAVAPLPKD